MLDWSSKSYVESSEIISGGLLPLRFISSNLLSITDFFLFCRVLKLAQMFPFPSACLLVGLVVVDLGLMMEEAAIFSMILTDPCRFWLLLFNLVMDSD